MNGEAVMDTVVLTPDGCNAVDIVIPHDDLVEWEVRMARAIRKINGLPFCETQIFTTQVSATCVCEDFVGPWINPTSMDTCDFNGPLDNPYTPTFPANGGVPFFQCYSAPELVNPGDPYALCGEWLEIFDVQFAGGDSGAYGELTVSAVNNCEACGTPSVRLDATGASDYTGISITITVQRTTNAGASLGPIWGPDIVLNAV